MIQTVNKVILYTKAEKNKHIQKKLGTEQWKSEKSANTTLKHNCMCIERLRTQLCWKYTSQILYNIFSCISWLNIGNSTYFELNYTTAGNYWDWRMWCAELSITGLIMNSCCPKSRKLSVQLIPRLMVVCVNYPNTLEKLRTYLHFFSSNKKNSICYHTVPVLGQKQIRSMHHFHRSLWSPLWASQNYQK